jgi:hypothetical protein
MIYPRMRRDIEPHEEMYPENMWDVFDIKDSIIVAEFIRCDYIQYLIHYLEKQNIFILYFNYSVDLAFWNIEHSRQGCISCNNLLEVLTQIDEELKVKFDATKPFHSKYWWSYFPVWLELNPNYINIAYKQEVLDLIENIIGNINYPDDLSKDEIQMVESWRETLKTK